MGALIKSGVTLVFTLCAAAAGAEEVSFTRDIVPVLKSRCVICHLPGGAQGGLALHPKGGYQLMVGIPATGSPLQLVQPGNPDDSYLMHKLEGTQAASGGQGERMPFGEAPLPAEQIEMIRAWIANGAPFN